MWLHVILADLRERIFQRKYVQNEREKLCQFRESFNLFSSEFLLNLISRKLEKIFLCQP